MMLWALLCGAVCIAVGVFLFLKPDIYWKMTEQWKSYSADEPSDFYLQATKFGGGAFIVGGVIIAVLPLILK